MCSFLLVTTTQRWIICRRVNNSCGISQRNSRNSGISRICVCLYRVSRELIRRAQILLGARNLLRCETRRSDWGCRNLASPAGCRPSEVDDADNECGSCNQDAKYRQRDGDAAIRRSAGRIRRWYPLRRRGRVGNRHFKKANRRPAAMSLHATPAGKRRCHGGDYSPRFIKRHLIKRRRDICTTANSVGDAIGRSQHPRQHRGRNAQRWISTAASNTPRRIS